MGPRGTELDPCGPITWSSVADSAPPSMPSSALAAWAGPAHFPQAPRGSGAGGGLLASLVRRQRVCSMNCDQARGKGGKAVCVPTVHLELNVRH